MVSDTFKHCIFTFLKGDISLKQTLNNGPSPLKKMHLYLPELDTSLKQTLFLVLRVNSTLSIASVHLLYALDLRFFRLKPTFSTDVLRHFLLAIAILASIPFIDSRSLYGCVSQERRATEFTSLIG